MSALLPDIRRAIQPPRTRWRRLRDWCYRLIGRHRYIVSWTGHTTTSDWWSEGIVDAKTGVITITRQGRGPYVRTFNPLSL
jgi:hypothetical protein